MIRKFTHLLWGFLPLSAASYFLGWPALVTFFLAAATLVYLAAVMGHSTEVVAARAGSTLGGVLNAALGNAAEFIIALVGVRAGLDVIVKASLTGSILGNALLVTGLTFFVGGVRYREQRFNVGAVRHGAKLMVIAVSALLMPSLFHYTAVTTGVMEGDLSTAIAVILIAAYMASIVFSFITHRHIFPHHGSPGNYSRRQVIWGAVSLVLTTAGMVAAAEVLVAVIEPTAHALGWGNVFIGVVIVAVAGNAAENFGAVIMGWRNRMDLALTITQGSTLQIALLVAPLVVIFSHFWPCPLDLIFTPLEVAAVALAMVIVSLVTLDGESDWFEGVLLLVLYAILAVTFFFLG